MTYSCPFCNQTLRPNKYQPKPNIYYCDYTVSTSSNPPIKCNASFFYTKDNPILTKYYFYYKTFVLRFDPPNKTFKIFEYSKSSFPIIQLNYLPNITPQNVQEKLPTLLTFM